MKFKAGDTARIKGSALADFYNGCVAVIVKPHAFDRNTGQVGGYIVDMYHSSGTFKLGQEIFSEEELDKNDV